MNYGAPGKANKPGAIAAGQGASESTNRPQGSHLTSRTYLLEQLAAGQQVVDLCATMPYFLTERIFENPHHRKPDFETHFAAVRKMVPPFADPANPHQYFATHLAHVGNITRSRAGLTAVQWFPDGRRVIGGRSNGEMGIWNGINFNFEDIKRGIGGALTSLAWTSDERLLLSGHQAGHVHVQTPSLAPVATLKEFTSGSHCVADLKCSPVGVNKAVGAAIEAKPVLWDLGSLQQERVFEEKGYDTCSLDWHPTLGLIAAGTRAQQIHLWDPRTAKAVISFFAHKSQLWKCRFSPNGMWLATSGRDSLLKLWDVRTLRCYRTFKSPTTSTSYETTRTQAGMPPGPQMLTDDSVRPAEVTCIAWHPECYQILATGDTHGRIAFWDAAAPQEQSQAVGPSTIVTDAHEFTVGSIAWHPLGHMLVSCSFDGSGYKSLSTSPDSTIKFWSSFAPGSSGGPVVESWLVGNTDAQNKNPPRDSYYQPQTVYSKALLQGAASQDSTDHDKEKTAQLQSLSTLRCGVFAVENERLAPEPSQRQQEEKLQPPPEEAPTSDSQPMITQWPKKSHSLNAANVNVRQTSSIVADISMGGSRRSSSEESVEFDLGFEPADRTSRLD